MSDYEKAINANTGLIMKVHTSNFRIVGFTEEADIESLVALGKEQGHSGDGRSGQRLFD